VTYIGVSVTGQDITFDLAGAPHLLVAGPTGSGKSVSLHSIILSLLLKHD
jgi:S-DNA-T family DNA segregation ATPase FtsK/SpoIIIE